MVVSLLLAGLTGLFWFLGMRNADEVIGILEKLMATLLLVLTLCVGSGHVAISLLLLAVALSLPRARAFAPRASARTPKSPARAASCSCRFEFAAQLRCAAISSAPLG